MVHYDKIDQYDKIKSGLLPGEEIIAVFDCIGVGTGFVGVTDKRIILQDNSFVGGKVAVVSVPYSNISSVAFVSDKSVFGRILATSSIAIIVGSNRHEATFREDDKAKYIHDYVLTRIM